MRIARIVLAVAVALSLDARAQSVVTDAAPSVAPPAACVPDCRGGFTCVAGRCISACNPSCAQGEACVGHGICERRAPEDRSVVAPAISQLPAPAAAVPRSASVDSNLAFHLNLLGLAQLGPTIALEMGGRTTSLSLRFRAMNAGALSYVIIAKSYDDQTLGFSYGLAAALRFYLGGGGNMRGFFVSPGVEYVSTRVEEESSIAYNTRLVIPELEIGYRWVFGSFLVDVGGGVGYAIVTDANSELLVDGATFYANDAKSQPGALGTVSIGAFF
jgi:hypothetical protein